MKFVCRDCNSSIMVTDKGLKSCPQCGSANVEFILRNGSIYTGKTQQSSMDRLAKVKIIFSIIGLIGFILLIAGGVTVVNSSGIDYFSQRQVGLNLTITGAIFLALAIAFFTRRCASCGQCCL